MTGSDEQSYSGRWVARLHGRIIAQGGTPEHARRAALSRYKETPEITFMPFQQPLIFPPIFDSIRQAIPAQQLVYLVGGAVRDAILGRSIQDLDFIVERDAISTARRVAKFLSGKGRGKTSRIDFFPLDPERDTGRIISTNEDGTHLLMDFSAFRGEDLEADLRGRDFTVNAIAMDINEQTIHDPLGGATDLKEKRLRACSSSAFSDDPVRNLRGVRLAANLGFHILPDTRKAMKASTALLGSVSAERMRDELFRLLSGLKPATCLRALDLLEALDKVLPELSALKGIQPRAPHVHNLWEHTLATVAHLESILDLSGVGAVPGASSNRFYGQVRNTLGSFGQQLTETFNSVITADRSLRSLLLLAAIYHDVAKPEAGRADEEGQLHFWDHDQMGAEIATRRGRALVLSNHEISRLEIVVRNHMRIHFHINRLVNEGKPPSRRAVYRFFRDTGAAGVDICMLTIADLLATYEQSLPEATWKAALEVVFLMLQNWFEKPAESISPLPWLNGNDLMQAFQLKPGRLVGEILDAIREAQATGKVRTREEALEFACGILEESRKP